MLKNFVILTILLGLLSSPIIVRAEDSPADATITIVPDTVNNSDQTELTVDVMIDPAGRAFNVAYIDLSFDQNFVELKDVDDSDSFCQLTVIDRIDNEQGNFQLACGTTRRDLATTSEMVKMHFTKKQSGLTRFGFNEALVLAADGLGTPLNVAPETHYFELN